MLSLILVIIFQNETYRNQISVLEIDLEQHKQAVQLKQDKIDQMEAYLAKLPTLEDYQETLNKVNIVPSLYICEYI